MSRRQVAQIVVCVVFLLLVALTVHSMYVEADTRDEDLVSHVSEPVYFTAGVRHVRSRVSHETLALEHADRPDAGAEDLITRELRRCIAIGAHACFYPDASPVGGDH